MAALPTHRPQPRNARGSRRKQGVAVRGSQEDRRSLQQDRLSGGRAVRDRLRPVRPAAYRHVRRGRAHDHGAACLPRADRGQGHDRLLCFSDDMDGMRKVPDNVPNQDMLRAASRQAADARARPVRRRISRASARPQQCAGCARFLDRFGFDYEFASSTDYYTSGRFDATLLKMLERYDEVMAIMLPTLREERPQTYSPFLPIHPKTGIVMQVPIDERNVDAGTIVWRDPDTGERFETPVTGGHAKLQWKPDWAMRWAALGVDYEMSGKDLDRQRQARRADLPHRSAAAARRLQLRAVPRRERPEDLEVEGQRPDHRRVADLRADREPRPLHVPEAEDGQEALFRRDPEGGRRVLHVPRRLSAAGMEGAARQSGLAHA